MFKGGAKKNSLDGRTPQSFFFWYNDPLLLIFGLNLHVEKKRTHERHFCFTFASQSALSCKNFLYWRWVTKIHCCVSEFTVTPSIIKEMQTSQYRKSRIWEMKNRCNRVCAIFHMRDIRKSVILKIINIGAAMLVSLWGSQIWPRETNRNICRWVFLQIRGFITWL